MAKDKRLEKAREAVDRAKAWLSRHAHVFAVRGFTALGSLLVLKGIIGLAT